MAATELSADTRARILDAAFEQVRRHGIEAMSVKSVAEAAGVSRQLLYFHYGNRAGLLLAMTRHHDRDSGFVARIAEARGREPVEAYEVLLRAWLAYLPDIVAVARALEAAHVTGDEGGDAWTDRMMGLHGVIERAVDRVAGAGRLRAGWTVAAAADWTWAQLQPARWAHLVMDRGWTAEEYVERTVRGLLAELVDGDADGTR